MPGAQLSLAKPLHFSGTVAVPAGGSSCGIPGFWGFTQNVFILGKCILQTVKKERSRNLTGHYISDNFNFYGMFSSSETVLGSAD